VLLTAVCLVGITGCGSAKPAGPPSPAALAHKLGCQIYDYFSDVEWSYDTAKAANLENGPCGGNSGDIVVITFPTQRLEDDWLHENALAQSAGAGNPGGAYVGYNYLAVGHLWVAGSVGNSSLSFVIRAFGGRISYF
jgi:hypothetical protein